MAQKLQWMHYIVEQIFGVLFRFQEFASRQFYLEAICFY